MSKWVVTIECSQCFKRYYDCWCNDKKENPEVLEEYLKQEQGEKDDTEE